jgi:small subunit ribosomal protein S1
MVHLSDLDWNKPGEAAIKDYKKGDRVKAKVLDVDPEKERVSLGIKQLAADPLEEGFKKLKKGDSVTCTVTAVTDGGIEVKLVGDIGGFIRRAELSRDRSEQRPDRFAPGDRVDAKIINIDRKDRKVSLSIKAHEIDEEKQAMAEYGSSDSGASLGEILGPALRRGEAEDKDRGKKDE